MTMKIRIKNEDTDTTRALKVTDNGIETILNAGEEKEAYVWIGKNIELTEVPVGQG